MAAQSTSGAPPEVVVVEHEEACPSALLGETLAAAGVRVRVARPYAGDALPGAREADGIVVMGGTMGADDDADVPWLTPLKALVRDAVGAGTPLLGVCLGHQVIATALGGRTIVNPRGQQVGVLEVGWLPEAARDPLLGPLAGRACRGIQWNGDVVDTLPAGAVALARTPEGELQAARYAAAAWGVQLHPEADRAIVEAWARGDRDDHLERGLDQDALLAGIGDAAAELRTAWAPLGAAFAALLDPASRSARGGT